MSTTHIIDTLKIKHKDGTKQHVYPKTLLQAVVDIETNQSLDKIVEDLANKPGTGSGVIVDRLDSTATDASLSANQGRVLNEKVEDIKTQAIVADYDESTAKLKLELTTPIQSLVENSLTSDSIVNALAAKQGKVLDNKINNLAGSIAEMYAEAGQSYMELLNLTWSDGYMTMTGVVAGNTDYESSDYIKLTANSVLKYSATGSASVALLTVYNTNKIFVKVHEKGAIWNVIDRYYHATEDCYVRISRRKTDAGINCHLATGMPTYIINKAMLMQNSLYGKSMLVIGDSLVAGNKIGKDPTWINQIGLKYNMTTYNYGINGNAVSNVSGGTGTPMSERYLTIYNEVPNADIIIVEGGANDKNGNCPIGTNADTTNSTFKGALNVLIDGLREKYPETVILFMTPFERYGNTNTLSKSETDYADAMLEVCRKKAIPCFDNIGDSGISFLDNNISAWADEGLYREDILAKNKHLTPKAYAYLAAKYEKWIAMHI